ncbi:AraC family transcriptional regulator [Paremcibacter congregatus]|uniref:AraC family transcriptional regulator n=1 Tax=Paremcibacter congregatus TaxID=2043170 RepID=UPI003A93E1F7
MMGVTTKNKPVRGIVREVSAYKAFNLNRFLPDANFADLIEHYWLIDWNLPDGVTHRQEVLPHPAVNMTFLEEKSEITGIVSHRFSHEISGKGNLVGVKFTPAGFYAFADAAGKRDVALTDQTCSIETYFPQMSGNFTATLLLMQDVAEKIKFLERRFFQVAPDIDPMILLVNAIVARICEDRTIQKVADLCEAYTLEPRKLQRLFQKYVGISAKWIIIRYRLHEALERVEKNDTLNWTDLALDLGYFDQSHFINDFKALLGQTPEQYQQSLDHNS